MDECLSAFVDDHQFQINTRFVPIAARGGEWKRTFVRDAAYEKADISYASVIFASQRRQ